MYFNRLDKKPPFFLRVLNLCKKVLINLLKLEKTGGSNGSNRVVVWIAYF
jgi:hypothetical protein